MIDRLRGDHTPADLLQRNPPICQCCTQSRGAVGYAVAVAPDMPIRFGACVPMMDTLKFH